MNVIVFLDIDDVIAIDAKFSGKHVAKYFKKELSIDEEKELLEKIFSKSAVSNIEKLNDEFQCKYVISSSWSSYINRQEMTEFFNATNLNLVSENLHKYWTTEKNIGRLSEIKNWISKHKKESEIIVIVDDNESGWNLKNSEFDINNLVVFCEKNIGFIDKKLEEARDILLKQIQ